MVFTGCSKTEQSLPHRYARLTVIYGKEDSFGTRYFWETYSEKTDAMNREEVHKYFGVELPMEDELKVTPFDYKVIDHLVQSGWNLVAVSSTGAYKGDAGKYKDAITFSPMTTYHFSR
jgi:hypothetical protein